MLVFRPPTSPFAPVQTKITGAPVAQSSLRRILSDWAMVVTVLCPPEPMVTGVSRLPSLPASRTAWPFLLPQKPGVLPGTPQLITVTETVWLAKPVVAVSFIVNVAVLS